MQFACPQLGNWFTVIDEPTRRAVCPTTPGSYVRRICQTGLQPDQDTWYFPRVAGTFKERAGWHGCQMPEQLLGRIIRACSNPGERRARPVRRQRHDAGRRQEARPSVSGLRTLAGLRQKHPAAIGSHSSRRCPGWRCRTASQCTQHRRRTTTGRKAQEDATGDEEFEGPAVVARAVIDRVPNDRLSPTTLSPKGYRSEICDLQ